MHEDIRRLESMNRQLSKAVTRLRVQMLVLAAVMGGLLLLGARTQDAAPTAVESMRFVHDGVTRAIMGPTPNGFGLVFLDEDGVTERLAVGSLQDRTVGGVPSMTINDSTGSRLVSLEVADSNAGPLGSLFVGEAQLCSGRRVSSQLFLPDTRPPGVFGEDAGYDSKRIGVYDFAGRTDMTRLDPEDLGK